MTPEESATRAAAWTWAAETLGQRVDSNRIKGLVDATSRVGADLLHPAIKAVVQSNDSDFLPNPAAVINAANRIAGERREAAQSRLWEHRRQKMLEAGRGRPANAEEIQEIRDKIEELSNKAKYGTEKPWYEKLKDLDDSRGIEAARRAVEIAEEAAADT